MLYVIDFYGVFICVVHLAIFPSLFNPDSELAGPELAAELASGWYWLPIGGLCCAL